MLTTPGGSSSSSRISPSSTASSGASGDIFTTTVQPASRAGASLEASIRIGPFQGMIAPTTPTGSWMSRPTLPPAVGGRRSTNANSVASRA